MGATCQCFAACWLSRERILRLLLLVQTPLYEFEQNFEHQATGQPAAVELMNELFIAGGSLQPELAKEQEVFMLMDRFFLQQVRKDAMVLSLSEMHRSVNKLADSTRKMVTAEASPGGESAAAHTAQVEEAARLRH